MKKNHLHSIFIGVAGGSGSGKTTFARLLQNKLGAMQCEIIYQDNFYIDQSSRFDHDGGAVNFDHPDAIDFEGISQSLQKLRFLEMTEIPIYDFETHKRKSETLTVYARRIVLVDGILIFHSPLVRDLFDYRVFFETSESVRFQRRLDRDVRERGRTPEGVKSQFIRQVKPMHDQFVEPSKQYAHKIVQEFEALENVVDAVISELF